MRRLYFLARNRILAMTISLLRAAYRVTGRMLRAMPKPKDATVSLEPVIASFDECMLEHSQLRSAHFYHDHEHVSPHEFASFLGLPDSPWD